MVIVYNKGALAVVLMGIVFLCPIALLWKFQVLEEGSIFLLGSWALFSASLIGTIMKLNGRFFLIFPTWLFTLPCALYTSYYFSGKIISFAKSTLFILFLLIIALTVFSLICLFFYEKKRKRNLFFQEIKIPIKGDGLSNYWKEIRALFFFPWFSKWSEDIFEYNIKVLQLLKENNIELRHAEEFSAEISRVKLSNQIGSRQNLNMKIKQDFFSDIDYQIKTWKS